MIWGGAFMVVFVALQDLGPLQVAQGPCRDCCHRPVCLDESQGRGLSAPVGPAALDMADCDGGVVHRPALCPAVLGAAICAVGLCRHGNGGAAAVCPAIGPCVYSGRGDDRPQSVWLWRGLCRHDDADWHRWPGGGGQLDDVARARVLCAGGVLLCLQFHHHKT